MLGTHDTAERRRFAADRNAVLAEYPLTGEERRALAEADVGSLHLMGVHPLLLAPFAGRSGLEWPDYLAALQRARDSQSQTRNRQDSQDLQD